METLQGTAGGTLFRNAENGYSVVSVATGEGEVTLIGTLPELAEGERIEARGDWTVHPQYGRQFRAASVVIQAPETLGAIEKYLGSGLIKGVGPSTARLIVEAFGKDTMEVLSAHPERLREVPKIGRKRMEQIAESFLAQQESRGTYLFLQRYGIPPALSVKINKQYRNRAEELIRQNPYRLIDEVEGVGFLTADRIAASIGIPEHSEHRVKACVKHVLQEAAISSGHTCLPRAHAIMSAADILKAEESLVERHLEELVLFREIYIDVIGGMEMASLPRIRQAEMTVAARLLRLCASAGQASPPHVQERIRAFERHHRIRFSPTQREAIVMAVTSGASVVTGGPGTGKTTLINCVLYVLGPGVNAVLAAPTGRAAKRLQEACGRDASTIHRLLQFGHEEGSFLFNRENPLDAECVIVDEVSMMDVFLMKSLLDALPVGARLLLVGDADQLPSVGPGNMLADILSHPAIPSARLTEIFRQAEGSMIVLNAHRVNRGEFPELN
ncbi:MAG TPA: AAA family ATPase, partial [Candidatus Limnocylindria bacterium]|nr:AAA family ATPase [Candidatus Limnocylindria bacterium]